MSRKIFIMTLLLMSIFSVNAREIKGTVKDSLNNPIEYANIAVFCNDSIVAGNITDANGAFS